MEQQMVTNSAVIHGLCAMTFQSAMHCLLRLAPTMINHLTSKQNWPFQYRRNVCLQEAQTSLSKSLLMFLVIPSPGPLKNLAQDLIPRNNHLWMSMSRWLWRTAGCKACMSRKQRKLYSNYSYPGRYVPTLILTSVLDYRNFSDWVLDFHVPLYFIVIKIK